MRYCIGLGVTNKIKNNGHGHFLINFKKSVLMRQMSLNQVESTHSQPHNHYSKLGKLLNRCEHNFRIWMANCLKNNFLVILILVASYAIVIHTTNSKHYFCHSFVLKINRYLRRKC